MVTISGFPTRTARLGKSIYLIWRGNGVFKVWNDHKCFEMVRITSYGAIAWGDDIELCPDALYMQLTGKSITEMAETDSSFANA